MTQTSEGSSRGSLENGGRERDHGSESDEDEDSEQNTSDSGEQEQRLQTKSNIYVLESAPFLMKESRPVSGPGWTANFRDSRGTAASQTPAGWESSGGSGEVQGTGWANFTEFQPFSG